ncbi:hypothetical protein NEOLI_004742 [Neolecta irregularis DAH-3]|uniref:Uncharacterized protein n=1 Tax=Neolecta irregularis (strain DAH-3) TaxID=1198029 RepID=A0A1U7LLE4_NEOID|nr:hypothetical protein NEOLI_004742 [Neolecta irregularis DAH-3]|eukprot:OLL23413.1 hypothetical protein NEOLI_004742 [Neolecta irregularis DAH-3]
MGPITVLLVTLLLSTFVGFFGIHNTSWLPRKPGHNTPFRAVDHDDETWDANAEEVGLRRNNPFDDEHAEHVENPFDDPRDTQNNVRRNEFKEEMV